MHVPLNANKEPVAPMGTMFWFRPEAFRGLLDHGWKYEDFPPEPNKVDGTLLHFIERAYGYVPQANGYYPAYIFSDRYARIEITNLSYELREVVKVITVPWIREDLQQTCVAIAEGKRFRNTLLRVIRNIIKNVPVIGPALVKLHRKQLGINEDE